MPALRAARRTMRAGLQHEDRARVALRESAQALTRVGDRFLGDTQRGSTEMVAPRGAARSAAQGEEGGCPRQRADRQTMSPPALRTHAAWRRSPRSKPMVMLSVVIRRRLRLPLSRARLSTPSHSYWFGSVVCYSVTAFGSGPNLFSLRSPSVTAKIKFTMGSNIHHPL